MNCIRVFISQLRRTALAALLLPPAAIAAETIAYDPVASDVSFASVISLPARTADFRFEYGTEQPHLQYGQLWLPPAMQPDTQAPLVIFIHGGCWLNEYDIQHTLPFATALAAAGYAVWSLEYRRTGDPGGGWPGTFDDIVAGVAFADTLQDYPVDLEHIAIMGHSAGGHLALLAGTRFGSAAAVIGLAAITDIATYARGTNSCQTVTVDFMGVGPDADPARYRQANPVAQQLHGNTFLLHGDRDAIVPVAQSRVAGTTAVLQPGASHFDWVHPGTAAFRRLLALLAETLTP